MKESKNKRNYRKMVLVVVLLICFLPDFYGQGNKVFIRNYNYSLVIDFRNENGLEKLHFDKKDNSNNDRKIDEIKIKDDKPKNSLLSCFSSTLYSDYGEIFLQKENKQGKIRYQYSGQELVADLGLLFFPSRVYSVGEMRFFQPDPKSQYFSPYLFVGADPINNIDLDGNWGVPLVIYGNDYSKGRSLDVMTEDFMNEKIKGHYISYNDFLEGNFGKVPRMNGNVFLFGHIKGIPGQEIVPAKYDEIPSKIPSEGGVSLFAHEGRFETRMSGRQLGRMLRKFASDHNFDVKNVMVQGCNGSIASKELAMGYSEIKNTGKESKQITTFGLKEGKISTIYGNRTASEKYSNFKIQPFDTEYHVMNLGDKEAEMQCTYPKGKLPKYKSMKYFQVGASEPSETTLVGFSDLKKMVTEARVPPVATSDFIKTSLPY